MSEDVIVSFDATDEDVQVLRTLPLRRLRVPLLEYCVHILGTIAALIVVAVALLTRRTDRLPLYLAGIATVWAAGWFYVAFIWLRRTPERKATHEKQRRAQVLTKGPSLVTVEADDSLP